MAAAPPTESTSPRLRPKSYTVFAAAFLAGAAAAVGVNRVLDVHLAQRRPQVESEPIFVALRPLPQGSPVTVWDVALKDWPKAMLPSSALRAGDSFEGFVLRHAIREGQPLLAVQLIRSGSQVDAAAAVETFVPAHPLAATAQTESAAGDLWTPSAAVSSPAAAAPAAAAGASVATPAPAPAAAAAVVAAAPAVEPEPESVPAQPTVAMPDGGADREPQPALTAAEPLPTAVDPPVAPSPAASGAAAPQQPTPAAAAADEVSEAVATDVASMPSVIKQPAAVGTPTAQPPAGDAGKYLVVPERIALQADTSFTTPRPQPPGPPAAARPVAGKPRATPRPAGQVDARRGGTPAAAPTSAPRQQPGAPSRTRPQSQPTREQPPPSAARRPWTAIAAGIEALGSPWQRPAATANRQQGSESSRR
ncbi:MAG: SAF domain-containing protein [Planctomycetaceae bacterium]